MAARTLDGRAVSATIKSELTQRVARLAQQGRIPGLGTVLVGDDPASRSYVAGKHRDCQEVGIASLPRELPADAAQHDVERVIDELNANPECTGYIVQLPLPEHIDTNAMLERIDPDKDADGLHPTNLGRLVLSVNNPIYSPLPCTPRGIIELLDRHGVELNGQHVVVVGRGVTVGRPIGLLLTRRAVNATVTLAHTGTQNLQEILAHADVVVAAAGRPHMITSENIKDGAVLLDVGVSRVDNPQTGRRQLMGDVDPASAGKASWISPNPGGVGPMTRAMLLTNVVETCERAATTPLHEASVGT